MLPSFAKNGAQKRRAPKGAWTGTAQSPPRIDDDELSVSEKRAEGRTIDTSVSLSVLMAKRLDSARIKLKQLAVNNGGHTQWEQERERERWFAFMGNARNDATADVLCLFVCLCA